MFHDVWTGNKRLDPRSYEAAIVVIRVDSSMLARIRMPNQADCTGCVVAPGSRALVRKNRRRWNE